MTDTQEYEIKKVGIGISDNVKETLIVRGEDGDRDEFKPGDNVHLTDEQATELRKLGVKLSKTDGSSNDEDDNDDTVPADETTPVYP